MILGYFHWERPSYFMKITQIIDVKSVFPPDGDDININIQ